jgi:hypothetical protein
VVQDSWYVLVVKVSLYVLVVQDSWYVLLVQESWYYYYRSLSEFLLASRCQFLIESSVWSNIFKNMVV